jgi:arylsulfatase A-like enzyme
MLGATTLPLSRFHPAEFNIMHKALLPFALTVLAAALPATTLAAKTKPNIIVVFVDDLGYADLGVQAQAKDVLTPHLDRLSAEGVRCTAGYVTAPQCSPSRVALLTGRYQQRFGIDTIPDIPMPLEAVTIAERLKPAGYISGMVGKWHLEPNVLTLAWAARNLSGEKPVNGRVVIPMSEQLRYYPEAQGFDEYFCGSMNRYYVNYSLQGERIEPQWIDDHRFRVDVQTDAAVAFVERNKAKPFFLYVAYFAPHTPLEIPPAYSGPFPQDMAVRRRAALSMMAGVDAGVGRIVSALQRHGLDENTLIIFTSDNGAPLKGLQDNPIDSDEGGWDGSLNTPWVGEKGMLSEGGIRVPFLVRYPGILPSGKVFAEPVSTLDVAATAIALAGLPSDDELDGVNLIPFLSGKETSSPHKQLFWRFWSQAAIREGGWKLLYRAGEPARLFDVTSKDHENINLADRYPERVTDLQRKLERWAGQLQPAGMPTDVNNPQERGWYQKYFNSKAGHSSAKFN